MGQASFTGKINMLRTIARWFSKRRPSGPQGPSVPGFKIRLYVIDDEEEIKPPFSRIVDLADAKQVFDLTRGFWNLCFVEARAVGESADAVGAFRRFITNVCNYRQGAEPRPGSSWLFHAGDESYPAELPFLFLCPTPDPSLTDESVPPRPAGYEPNFELFLQWRRDPNLRCRP
jgi:hypothetical protein